MKYISKLIIIIFVCNFFFLTYSCKDSVLPILNIQENKKCNIEYDYELNDIWIKSYSENTIKHGFSFIVNGNNTNLALRDIRFVTSDGCFILQAMKNMTDTVRNLALTVPYYLCAGWDFSFPFSGDEIIGISSHTEWHGDGCGGLPFGNWAYIFKSNIDANCRTHGLTNHETSAYNSTIIHELCHQIGRVMGDSAHIIHDGVDSNKCPLWDYWTQELLDTLRHDARGFLLCPIHTARVTNGPELTNISMEERKANIISSNDTDLRISLVKTEFKEYEPILVRFDYINNHNKIDTLYNDFLQILNKSLKFYVTSENGNVYEKEIFESPFFLIISPQFFVKPGDTFSASMVLNYNIGEPIECENRYFNYFGYFKPGNYKFYAHDVIGGMQLKTNELTFKVENINEQDKKVLDLLRNKRYDEIFSNYSANTFSEHVLARYCEIEIYPIETWHNDIQKINSAYFDFVNKYPNSLYNINLSFIGGYFNKVLNYNPSAISIINNLKNNTNSKLIDNFVDNHSIKER
ncbi:MAG: hypothetical protein EHM58_20140, partial [Ignavibacteriae bacterium]